MVDRGQALTLESITASILLLAALGFALQMTAVTPLSASTSSQHLENQLQSTGEGVLTSTAETGTLEDAVLYWNSSELTFHNSGERSFYQQGNPDNRLGVILNETYGERNIAYNVIIHYQTATGETRTKQMVRQGEPSDHAVSASISLTLTDNDKLVLENGTEGQALGDTSAFYAPDAAPDRPLYNVIRIEVVAWRI